MEEEKGEVDKRLQFPEMSCVQCPKFPSRRVSPRLKTIAMVRRRRCVYGRLEVTAVDTSRFRLQLTSWCGFFSAMRNRCCCEGPDHKMGWLVTNNTPSTRQKQPLDEEPSLYTESLVKEK